MVAIVSGNNTGLLNTSAGVLGQLGLGGSAVHGSSKEAAYVNVFNGNLALQDGDSFLASNGLNLSLTRTYNSQATLSDATNNGWQDVLLKQVKLIGTLNDAASTVQRLNADGSVSVFTYRSDNVYYSTDGDGGYQTLTFTPGTGTNLGQWTWTSDRTDLLGPYEVYDMNQAGYIVKAGDQVAVRQTYTYTKLATTPATYQLNKVTDAAGDALTFTYTGANLTKVTLTPVSGSGNAYTVSYAYDAQNRLKTVTLTRDSLTYSTNYSYAADVNGVPSQLITGISQSDGTRMSFAYANGKVKSYTLYANSTDLIGHTTAFSYAANGNTTTVTDPLMNTVTYGYDAKGQLTSVTTPASGTVSYSYDDNGNVLTVTDARRLTTTYEYDANGNRTKQTDAAGNIITRSYAAGSNLLLSETTYQKAGADASLAVPQTERYVYDRFNRLRYTVSAEGRVTEYVYPEAATATAAAQVQYSAVRNYTANGYPSNDGQATIALKDLEAWATAQIKTVSNYTQTNYSYNTRGLVSQTVTANNDTATTSTVSYTYNATGQLLTVIDGLSNKTTYTYDGLGRQLTKIVTNAGGTAISSAASSYAANATVVTETLNDTRTSPATTFATNTYTYDSAGELVSVQQSGVSGATRNRYDADGQLRVSTSPGGQNTYWLYDGAGRKVAEINAAGRLTELVYNEDSQLIKTIIYNTLLDATTLTSLQAPDGNGNIVDLQLDSVRPGASPLDRSSWNFYDNAGRLADSVDGSGYVTHYDYDGASRLTLTTLRATRLSDDAFSTLQLKDAAALRQMSGIALATSDQESGIKQLAAATDRSSRKLYDKDGLLRGQVDAYGYLTEYRYNAAGSLVETITYSGIVKATSDYTLDQLRPNTKPEDIHEYRVYDTLGRLSGSVDGDGYLTELVYDAAGNISKRISYANKSGTPNGAKLSDIKTGITTSTSADNRTISYSYDALGRVLTETNSFAYVGTATVNWVNTYSYDPNGKLSSIAHSTGGTTSSKTYDGQGRLLTESAGTGAVATTYAYNEDGLLVRKTDPNGAATVYYYDAAGRLSYTVDALGRAVQQSYNNFGQVVSTRSYATTLSAVTVAGLGGGRVTATIAALFKQATNDQRTLFYYDAAGRLNYTVAPDGEIDGRSYTNFGELKSTVHYAASVSSDVVLDADTGNMDKAISDIIANTKLKNQVSTFRYDADGRLTYSVDAEGNAQETSYDALGHALTITQYDPQGKDRVQSYAYNERGLVTDYTDALGNHSITTYNGFGQAVTQAQRSTAGSTAANIGQDPVTRTIYDENGRIGASIDPLGVATFYQYNGDGNLIDKISYAVTTSGAALSATQLSSIDTQLASGTNTSTPLLEIVRAYFKTSATEAPQVARQQFVYDSLGRLSSTYTAQLAGQWALTTLSYDNNGNVVSRIAYAQRVSSASPIAASTLPKPAASVSDHRERMIYDAAGRLTDTLTALNTVTADGSTVDATGKAITLAAGSSTNWSLVSYQYDAFGNVLQRTAFATPLSVATNSAATLDTDAPSPTSIDNLKKTAVKENAVTVYRYDAANRITLSASAQSVSTSDVRWNVVSYQYNGTGQLSGKTEYGHTIVLKVGTSPLDAEDNMPKAEPLLDRTTAYEYDLNNRLVKTTDALNGYVLLAYDARGNLVKRTQHSDLPKAEDRITRIYYDLNNRPLYQVDATGHLTQNTYDALGKLVAVTEYAKPVIAGDLDKAAIDKLLSKPDVSYRSVHYIYDQAGQLRYTVDADGYLTQQTYDAIGRPLASTTYATKVGSKFATAADYTLTNANAAVSVAGTAHTTSKAYDAMGNVSSVTDAEGGSESYTYDALGNKLTYTNQMGAKWNYTYNAAGQLLAQVDPATTIYADGATATSSGTSISLLTLLQYDAFGNLIARTEAKNTANARITGYGYDLQGHQITTILPALAVYNSQAVAGTDGRTESAKSTHTIEVTYDGLGNAITNQDVGGQNSYKIYDKLGRVIYDIDATGHITGYERNGFGEVIKLTRYANQLTYGEQGQLIDYYHLVNGVRSSPDDRSITTSYDAAGRVLTVTEPAVTVYDQQTQSSQIRQRTTKTEYDAYGNVASVAVYGTDTKGNNPTPAAVTRYYYDVRGNRTAQIIALSSDPDNLLGYLTTYDYDAEGNQTNVKEFATAIQSWDNNTYTKPAATAADRETSYRYDGNQRKIQETKVAALLSASDTGSASDIVTNYKYDAAGNQILSAIVGGVSTITYYDALGRSIGVAQLAPSGTTTTMPVSLFKLDAYGNVLVRTDYIGGTTSTLLDSNGKPNPALPAVDSANVKNRTTITSYDLAGHALKVVDANGNASFVSYDVYGRAAKQWRTVTNSQTSAAETWYQINEYDQLGHLVNVTTPGNVDLVNASTVSEINQHYEYNAFGEATKLTTTSGSLVKVEYSDYDNAGRIWRTNRDDGIDKVTLFDAQGNATVQIRSISADQGKLHELKSVASAAQALTLADIQRTDTRYDLMGRAVDVRQSTGPQLAVMVHDAYSGGWNTQVTSGANLYGDALLVIGNVNDAGQTITVQYRIKGSPQWIDQSTTRLQWINGVPVFNSAGLAGGDYEYRVFVQPQGETSYQRESGSFTINAVAAVDQDKPLIQLYVMLFNRLPDMAGLNVYLNWYNNGGSLAQMATQFLISAEASQLLPKDSTALFKQILLQALGRNGTDADDPTYASDLAYWVNRYSGGDDAAHGQVMVDFIQTMLTPTNSSAAQARGKALVELRVQTALEYLKAGGNNSDTALKLYQEALSNPSAVLLDAAASGKKETRSSQIAQIYLALLARPPLQSEMDAAMAGSSTLDQIITQLLGTSDAQSPLLYPKFSGQSDQDYIQRVIYGIYWNVLGHLPDTAEYTAALASMAQVTDSGLKLSQFALKIIHDTAAYAGTDAARLAQKQLFNNRLAVALAYMPLAAKTDETAKLVGKAVISNVSGTGTAAAAISDALSNADLSSALAQSVSDAATAAAAATPLESMQMQIARLYAALLNRAPDAAGFAYQVAWLQSMGNTPAALAEVAQHLIDSAEARGDASLTAVTTVNGVLTPLTNAQFVDQVYKLALGKVPTSAGAIAERQRFVAQLPGLSRGQVALNIITGMLGFQGLTAEEAALKATFNNKAAVGLVCATDLAQFNWPDTADTTVAKGILAQVTASDTQTALNAAYKIAQASLLRLAANTTSAASAAATALSNAAAASLDAYNAGVAQQSAATAAASQPDATLRLQIMQIYIGILGRSVASYSSNPDLAGFNFQVNAAGGATLAQIVQSIIVDSEGVLRYPEKMLNSEFVAKVFNTMLGGNLAAPEDLAYWTAQMSAPASLSRGQVAVGILNFIQNYDTAKPTAAAQNYLIGKKQFYQNVAAAFTALDSAQQKAANDAAAAVAPVTSSDAQLAVLLDSKTSTGATTTSAVNAANSALSGANSAGDGSAAARYQLTLLYATLLKRSQAPSLTELNYYTPAVAKNGLPAIAQEFIESAEAKKGGWYPADNDLFIKALYQNILGRSASDAEVAYWRPSLVNNVGAPYARGALAMTMLTNFLNYTDNTSTQISYKTQFDQKISSFLAAEQTEAQAAADSALNAYNNAHATTVAANKTLSDATTKRNSTKTAADNAAAAAVDADTILANAANQKIATRIYIGLRGYSDYAGVAYWSRNLSTGAVPGATFIDDLMNTLGYPSDATGFLQALYSHVHGRTASADEIAWWTSALANTTRADVASQFLNSAEANTRLQTTINNQVAADIQTSKDRVAARTSTASAYTAALSAYNDANTAYTNAYSAEQSASAASSAAAKVARATDALKNAQPAVVTADQSYSISAKASEAYATAKLANDQLHVTYATQIATNASAQPAAAADHLALALANANAAVASSHVAIGAAYISDQAAPLLQQRTTRVVELYLALLNRAPTLAETLYWTDKMAAANPQELGPAIVQALMASPEGATLYPATMSNDAFIIQLYRYGLDRDLSQDVAGLRYWSDKLSGANPLSRADLAAAWVKDTVNSGNSDAMRLQNRAAATMRTLANEAKAGSPNLQPAIQLIEQNLRAAAVAADAATALAANSAGRKVTTLARLYIGLLNRLPDAAGLAFWFQQLQQGATLAKVAHDLIYSGEAITLYPAGQSDHDFLVQVYATAMGRVPSEAEIAPYVARAANSSRADAVVALLNDIADGSPTTMQQDVTRAVFNGKVQDGLNYLLTDIVKVIDNARTAKSALEAVKLANPVDRHPDDLVVAITAKAQNGMRLNSGPDQLVLDRWGNVLVQRDVRDANWTVAYTYNDAGQVVKTVRNGGGLTITTANAYDLNGKLVQTTDGRGNVNQYKYDANGALLSETHADFTTGTALATIIYTNDAFGQHTKTQQHVASGGTNSVLTTYTYDNLGHQLTRESAAVTLYWWNAATNTETSATGVMIEKYAYDELGRRTSSTSTTRITSGTLGDPNQTTTTYTRYDFSGNIISTTNELGKSTLSSYDAFNHKTAEKTTTNETRTWSVDAFGRATSSTDLGTNTTRYTYNASGQLLRQYGAKQDINYSYDAATGQVISINDKATGLLTTYTYDAAGNRVTEKIWSSSTLEKRALQDNTLRYDAFNRLTSIISTIKGANYNVSYEYDNAGDRTRQLTTYTDDAGIKNTIDVRYGYDKMNRVNSITGTDNGVAIQAHTITYNWMGNRATDTAAGVGETYTYDLAGRLTQIASSKGNITQHYDSNGRIIYIKDSGKDEIRYNQYDMAGHLTRQRVTSASGALKNTIESRYDDLGNASQTIVTASDNSTKQTTDYAYDKGDGYLLRTTTVRNSTGESKSSVQFYDANNNVKSVEQRDGNGNVTSTTGYIADYSGHLLEKGAGNDLTHSLYANDQLIGSSSNSYETFSSVYDAANSSEANNQPTVYVVQSANETLQSIAKAVWGDERLWYLIDEANGGIDGKLQAGQQVNIPTRVNVMLNGYETFKPYNKISAIGDTKPELALAMPTAQSSGGGGCGVIGKLIMVVVAVAVTYITAGAATAYLGSTLGSTFGSIAGSMVGAAAGSVASQGVGIAIGAQDGFSWNAVAKAGLQAGITSGVGQLADYADLSGKLGTQSWSSVATNAAVQNAVSQSIGNITGLQHGFSWASVAGSFVGSSVTSGLQQSNWFSGLQQSTTSMAINTISGVASGLTKSIVAGGKIQIAQIATDAFGNALGSSLAESMKESAANRQFIKALDKTGTPYTLDDNGRPVADLNYRASFNFVQGSAQGGASLDEILQAKSALASGLNRLDSAPGDLSEDVLRNRTANALAAQVGVIEGRSLSLLSSDLAAGNTSFSYLENVSGSVTGPNGASIIGNTFAGGITLMTEFADFYAEHEFAATATYKGVQAVLSGGPVKTVVLEVAKMGMESILRDATGTIANVADNQTREYVTDYAQRKGWEFELSVLGQNVTVGPEQFGQAAGRMAGGIVESILGRGVDAFASRGDAIIQTVRGPYRGGPHSATSLPRNDGLDSHHIPDRNANPLVLPSQGPAIQMTPRDHGGTSSNGQNGRASAIYRAETADMISQGRYRDAMAREILDVRRAAAERSGDRTKYNEAISEMMKYARSSGQLPINPRTGK
ncbi:DUF4214 domain-containing protein [Duganella guangzhouensis]|nr:DUF4214 domain-containing protein [Duganella guangzhouensis]